MKRKKDPSQYDLLKGRNIFTDEPLWFRLIIHIISGAFLIGVGWVLREWAIPFFAVKGISAFNFTELLNSFKGRSP